MEIAILSSDAVFLIGRILFGGVLAFMGLNHFMNAKQMSGMTKSLGVPEPELAVYLSGAILILGALSIALGLFVDIGVLLLFLFLAPVTFTAHAFWKFKGEQQQSQMVNFLKNMVILGASLVFAYIPPELWVLSINP